jgi:dihydropteroate synthase
MQPRVLHAGRFRFVLDRPLIMGVVNVTPDSFSDGGRFLDPRAAVDHARALISEGADIIDVGGESTRPGAPEVPVSDELRRILPVIDALARTIPLSVDTSKPEVMREALRCGASMINDVAALGKAESVEAVVASEAAVCLMHMQGTPRTMQVAPSYDDVVAEVAGFLRVRATALEDVGIARERIVIDPGFGFGKTTAHNLTLLRQLGVLRAMGWPVLAGLSRKSMLGRIAGRELDDRMPASVAAAMLAVQFGADIVRVHDVGPTRDALQVLRAVLNDRFASS